MAKVLSSLQELRDALEAESLRADELDAAIQNIGDADDQTDVVADLEAQHEAQVAEVRRLNDAIERKEKMQRALERVPRNDDGAISVSDARGRMGLVQVTSEPATYRPNGAYSFFQDILHSTRDGDMKAQSRLQRHLREMEVDQRRAESESRAMTTGAGSGVGFVPPQYLQERWAQFARAARPLADALGSLPLPTAGVAFNVPRVTTGAGASVQASEAGAVADFSPVTDDVVLNVSTIAGKVDMSRQAFDRSEPGLDMVVGQDLSAAYNQTVDSEIINGPGSGGRVKGFLSAIPAGNQVTLGTTGYPALYPKFADAIQRVDTGRFLPADFVAMHPRRWASLIGALDSSNRPLVLPGPQGGRIEAFNPAGAADPNIPSQGFRGYLSVGLPCLVDANIPTNLGAGTNEDRILVIRRSDNLLFESGQPTIRVYEELLSGTLQVRIQAYGYIAFTAERYPLANAVIQGAGLVPPTF